MERKSDKITTGIAGLDDAFGGGITSRSQLLIAGGPGTGKTLMTFEILYNAAKTGIPCAFITLDEKPENMLRNMRSTLSAVNGIDSLDKLIKDNMIVIGGEDSATKISTNIESETSYSLGNLVSDVEAIIKSVNAEIVVVDSLSFLKLMLGTGILYSKIVSSLVSSMRRLGVTSLLTIDIPYYSKNKLKFAQELLLFDGIVTLYNLDASDKEKFAMEVVKMRGSNHYRKLLHYEITQSGIKIE